VSSSASRIPALFGLAGEAVLELVEAPCHDEQGDHQPSHGLGDMVRSAHADAWQAEGRLRQRHGGGVCAVRGARAMASGIRTPKWNNADVTHEQIDIEALSAWYAARGRPWSLRIPLELSLAVGEPLFVKRCMGLAGAPVRRRRVRPLGGRDRRGDGRYRRQCAKRRAGWSCRHGHRHRSASRCRCPAGEGAVVRIDQR
jgi:hypothetical protein